MKLLGKPIGDANFDGVFNSADLVAIFAAGEFEDDVAGNSTLATGDWNCDGDFGTGDLVIAFQAGAYVAAARNQLFASGTELGFAPIVFDSDDDQPTNNSKRVQSQRS